MLVMRHSPAIAEVITAAAVTVPTPALASRSGPPPGRPAPLQVPAASASRSGPTPSQLIALAASARVSVSQTTMHQGNGDVGQW